MASSARGLQLMSSLQRYAKDCKTFDSSILKKIQLVTASDGILKGHFTVDEAMCNSAGYIHGGHIAAVVDVFGFFSQLTNATCKLGWTTSMNLNYMEAAKISEQLSVEAKLLKVGNISVCETSIKNQSDTLVAKGTLTFKSGSEPIRKLVIDVLKLNEENLH